MKKITLFLLIATYLYSDAQVYLGLSQGYYNESFKNGAKTSSSISTFKAGYGDRKKYAVEFSLEYLNNPSKVFSQDDSSKFGLNISLVKAFDLSDSIYPFFKAGFGTGSLNISRQTQDMLNYGSFNLGAGVLFPINYNYDLEIGYNYKRISYEGIDTIYDNVDYTSNLYTPYIGLNVRF